MESLLKIDNLHAELVDENATEKKEILKGVSLNIQAGEIHAIMGPNGSGKSTLSAVITGRPEFAVTSGGIFFKGENIVEDAMDERAKKGVFLAYQNPVSIPGVNNLQFLRQAANNVRRFRGQEEWKPSDFLKQARAWMEELGLHSDFAKRALNDGFSGGEKKRNEILQMLFLEPDLLILDELDSGLDVDGLITVSKAVKKYFTKEKSILLITHYQKLLNYIEPDHVHIFSNGRIVRSGGQEISQEVDEKGYEPFLEAELEASSV